MLRRSAALAIAAAVLLSGTMVHVRAALDDSTPAAGSGLELVVLEVEDCFACDLVRRHIQPAYARAPRSRDVPLRYVDLNQVDEGSLGLATPVTTVPTIVLRRDGREVSRIAGYTGPATFFEAIEYMLALAE